MNTAPNLKQTVYNAIMEDIFSCTYLPGDIINEKSLIEKYECSKSPVRDALQALCAEHVLRSIPRYGYEVITSAWTIFRRCSSFDMFWKAVCSVTATTGLRNSNCQS